MGSVAAVDRNIVTRPAVQCVIAGTALQQVVVGAADDQVVAIAAQHVLDADQQIGLDSQALRRIVNALPIVESLALRQVNMHAGHRLVVFDPIVAGTAVDRVIATAAVEPVVGRIADNQVAEVRTFNALDVVEQVNVAPTIDR